MFIHINEVTKAYQNHVALDKVSMQIPAGIIFGLLGPNGAGKTSLIRILTQITEPDSGSILFKDRSLRAEDIYNMGYLPEERGLYKKMTVMDQLLYFGELKGIPPREARKKLKYWVDKFDIASWLSKKVEELSKGMQQKVQFIATVMHEPELIILDEPFSGLDPQNAQILTEEILQLKRNGSTIIFSTHRMDSVELLCDQIALINQSKKVLDGEVKSIKQQFKLNRFEITYTGPTLASDNTFNIISQEEKGNLRHIIIEPLSSPSNNDLLCTLINKGAEILSFSEKLPTMEEIFISAVNKKNNPTL